MKFHKDNFDQKIQSLMQQNDWHQALANTVQKEHKRRQTLKITHWASATIILVVTLLFSFPELGSNFGGDDKGAKEQLALELNGSYLEISYSTENTDAELDQIIYLGGED